MTGSCGGGREELQRREGQDVRLDKVRKNKIEQSLNSQLREREREGGGGGRVSL